MSVSHLRLVDGGIYQLGREPRTTAERVRDLQAEARELAREQVEEFQAQLLRTAAMAEELSAMGESVPTGLRDIAQRLAKDLPERSRQMDPLVERFWVGQRASKLQP